MNKVAVIIEIIFNPKWVFNVLKVDRAREEWGPMPNNVTKYVKISHSTSRST